MKKTPQIQGMELCSGPEAMATREFLARVSDKWSILVVMLLARGPKRRARFSELQKSIHGISQTMLTSTLRALERDGLVVREVFPEVPPRVEYELTELGASVLKPMQAMAAWVEENWGEVRKARERFDRKKAKG